MLSKILKITLTASLVLIHAVASAEDIDLFAGTSSGGSNVLIFLDNTSNWSSQNQQWPGGITQGEAELNALKTVINSLERADKDSQINVGLMMLTDGNNNPAGGYVRSAMKQMTVANRAEFLTLIDQIYANFRNPSEKGPASMDYDRAMFEVFKYFGGYTSPANATSDVAGAPISSTQFGPLRYAKEDPKADDAAFVSAAKNTYKPASGSDDTCPRNNYLVFIGNGYPSATSDEGAGLLPGVGGSATQIYNENPTSKNRFADEWARYLYQTDVSAAVGKQNVVTYTINVYNAQPSAEQNRLLTSMAVAGGGTPFNATSAAAIVEALKRIFSEIQSVNSAFASASLPVSVNTQGTYLNQVFIGMFRPQGKPRWFGNLKQYQFRADVDAAGKVVKISLADKLNIPVINPLNGFITPCAASFWSTSDSYWPDNYLGSCKGSDVASNLPDGEIVEKGAAAQRLRALSGHAARNVKTCNASCTALTNFDTGNAAVTKALLGNGSMTDTDRTAIINWSRGQNVDNELLNGTTVMRPSAHGDVVHSRPLAVDYGGTTGVVVFYGGNDGMFRAINGNKVDTAGNELWSFVAPDHYGKLNRLKSNSPIVSFPGFSTVSPEPAPTSKDYFFDGPIGVYRSGSSVWIYPTMRRGGNSVYAFDVSSPTSPILKWKRDVAQLANIGQTWSEPKVAKVAGYGSGASPVIIMGGGYDNCEDQDAAPNTSCTTPKGNMVFVLDAFTGTLLTTLTTDRSVAADVTVVDSNGDGLADIAYAVDTGANIYRINIGTAAPASWTLTKIAALGCNSSAACSRKFLYAPEVVRQAGFNAVLVGSGNRERPLISNQATNVDNAFFMIKDDRSPSPTLITTSALLSIDPDTALTTSQKAQLALSTNKGWYLALGSGEHDKEQVVTSAVVVAGVAHFSTHMPTVPNACGANLGTARGYAVNFLDASTPIDSSTLIERPRFVEFRGGGLPPSPVAGVATINPTNEDGTSQTNDDGTPRQINVPFVIGAGISGIDPELVEVNPSGVRGRVYWYKQR